MNGWREQDFLFNDTVNQGPPGSAYQIVSALPTPIPALVGTLFYLEGTPGNLYVLRTNALGQLVYTLLGGRTARLWFSTADFTPFGVGYDTIVKIVPYNISELPDFVSINWAVEDIFLRLETPAISGDTSVQIAYSTGTGNFSTAGFLNAAPVVVHAGSNEPAVRPAVISTPTIASGDKLKAYFPSIGTGGVGFSVYIDLRESN